MQNRQIPDSATVTLMEPLTALAGTKATMLVALQLFTVATWPLNVTVLDCCRGPKSVPVIVTESPGVTGLGDTPEMAGSGAGLTVNENVVEPNVVEMLAVCEPVAALAGIE